MPWWLSLSDRSSAELSVNSLATSFSSFANRSSKLVWEGVARLIGEV